MLYILSAFVKGFKLDIGLVICFTHNKQQQPVKKITKIINFFKL